MPFAKFMAQQLGNPSGMISGLVLAPLWNKRNSALNDVAFESLAPSPDDRVLEVGFGGGYLLGRISAIVKEGFLAGVDVSPAMVAFCERRYRSLVRDGRLEVRCARAESLPYPPDYFTKVCTVNSIFYWENISQALSEFWRVLAHDGILVMCFTCKESLGNRGFAKYVASYDADEVQQMMESSGFHAVRTIRSSDRHREFLCMACEK